MRIRPLLHNWALESESSPVQATEDGAFMEPRGCNRWQSVANRIGAEAAETSQNRCRRLRPVAVRSAGKEGVDGSSPSEGLKLLPAQTQFLLPRSAAKCCFDVHRTATAWTSAVLRRARVGVEKADC